MTAFRVTGAFTATETLISLVIVESSEIQDIWRMARKARA